MANELIIELQGSMLTRSRSKKIRKMIMDNLKQGVIIYFNNVNVINQGSADELLGKLIEEISKETFKEKIELENLYGTNKSVATYVISQRLKHKAIKGGK